MQLVQPKFRVCAKFSNLEISRFFELFQNTVVPGALASSQAQADNQFLFQSQEGRLTVLAKEYQVSMSQS